MDSTFQRSTKMAIFQRPSRLYRCGFRRIQAVEWLEHYIEARNVAMTEKNILSAWQGVGLFPENMFPMPHQTLDKTFPATITSISSSTVPILTSSPPEPSMLRSANQNFLSNLTSSNTHPRIATHVLRLSGITERLQTEVMLLKRELDQMKAVHGKAKERESGKETYSQRKDYSFDRRIERWVGRDREGNIIQKDRENSKGEKASAGARPGQ